ncbi:MAG: hypothetical protein C0469_06260 [Cyanobacteria bacterium DS2.3.42]|nr:hypothetical protein [Cyanobacteria bacterium DS2.3.42]
MGVGKTHIWKEDHAIADGAITVAVVIESPLRGKSRLWFKLPLQFESLVSESLDPFVVANIFFIMGEGTECILHGSVSPSLLRNLAEFQSAWATWKPDKYKQVEIIADELAEEAVAQNDLAIAAFSGGVDSAFTMYRHRTGACPVHWRRNIDAGLFVHGFDIPLDQSEAFDRASERIGKTLASLDVRLITMSTNLQELNIEWDDTHIAGVASALMLFKKTFCEGLVPSGPSYHKMLIPWGSSPITDHLLSSNSFAIVHDGAGFKRVEKRELLEGWEEGFQNLRVCFLADHRDKNCGRCSKCLVDMLDAFRTGKRIPASFPEFTDQLFAEMIIPSKKEFEGWNRKLVEAKRDLVNDSWLPILEKRLNELRPTFNDVTDSDSKLKKLGRRFGLNQIFERIK